MGRGEISVVSALGEELRALRKALGLTQAEVAERMGHSSSVKVSNWENGDPMSPENFRKIAAALQSSEAHLRKFGKPANPRAPRTTRRQRAARAQGAAPPADSRDTGVSAIPPVGGDLMFWKIVTQLTDEQQLQLLRQAVKMLEANEAATKKGVG